jgi:hypothetical protein
MSLCMVEAVGDGEAGKSVLWFPLLTIGAFRRPAASVSRRHWYQTSQLV